MEGADEDEAAATLTETATGGDEYRPGLQDDEDPGAAGAFGVEQLAAGGAEEVAVAGAVPLTILKGATTRVACPRCGTVLPQSRLRTHQFSKRCSAGLLPRGGDKEEDGEVAEGVVLAAGPTGDLLCPFPDCGKTSPNLKALRKHYNSKHGEQKHTCKLCAKSFGRSDLLSRHAKVCGQPRQWACVCKPEKPFTTLFNFMRHVAGREDHYNIIPPKEGATGTKRARCGAGADEEEGEGEAMREGEEEEEDIGVNM